MAVLRFGVLGAASIAPTALYKPARAVGGVEITAVAARDPRRAAQVAARWGVARVHTDYAAVLDDPAVDAVYIPLPNSLHAQWTLAAIRAGKHVLVEKPFASNAVEAQTVAEAADAAAARSGIVVMEAFHYRYHPLLVRVLDLLARATIGRVQHVEAELSFPLLARRDIRYRLDLSGGAMMDAGCYAVHCVRQLGQGEPEVLRARAKLRSPGVDRAMTASLRFPDGATATVRCSLWSRRLLGVSARAVGDGGEIRITNFVAPQLFNRLSVRSGAGRWSERVAGEPTYNYQLRAFAEAVRDGTPVLTSASDAVATMRVIDACYLAAGLQPRGMPAG